jgi:hypothetical protein
MHDSDPEDNALKTKALLFLHIHKTAGTTLHRIIEREYNPFQVYTIEGRMIEWSINHFKKLPQQRRAALRVVKGHMSFGLHEFLPQPSTYITFLRDPVERSISSYYYAKGNPLNPFHKRIAREKIDLPTFLDLTPWNNNLQCKALGGVDRREFRPLDLFMEMARPGAIPPDPGVDRWSSARTLQKAQENLTRYFSFIGLTERFTESLVLLKHLFGWKLSSYSSYRISRNRPKRESLDSAILAAVEKRNQFDRALYEFGKKIFDDSLDRADIDMECETEAVKAGTNVSTLMYARHVGSTVLRAAASRLTSLL